MHIISCAEFFFYLHHYKNSFVYLAERLHLLNIRIIFIIRKGNKAANRLLRLLLHSHYSYFDNLVKNVHDE